MPMMHERGMVSREDRPVTHRFCPDCGTEAVAGGLFCGACGHSLVRIQKGPRASNPSQTLSQRNRCLACGTTFTHHFRGACPDCGTKLTNTELHISPTSASPSAVNQPTQSRRPAASSDISSPRRTPIVKQEDKGGRSKKASWIVLIVLLVVGAGGAGAIIAHHHSAAPQASASQGAVAPSTAAAPTSGQFQQYYDAGYSRGQGLRSMSMSQFQINATCRSYSISGQTRFADPYNAELQAQSLDGCMAGAGY